MKLFNIILIPCNSASDVYLKIKKRMMFHAIVEVTKLILILAIALFVMLEYVSPFAQKRLGIALPDRLKEIFPFSQSGRDPSVTEVLTLANLIRVITDHQLPESRVLKYAGLISHASQKHGVNPLEIIALIMAESGFKENSINRRTGDYGLGQINWEHWGKDYGFTPQELLDPSINIFLTCHVYKFFGQDFGRYHRGHGIKSKAYVVNVKGILSTLNALAARES